MSQFYAGLANVEKNAALNGFQCVPVPGAVSEAEADTVNRLVALWRDKYEKNRVKTAYFNCEQEINNLNVSLPSDFARRCRARVGWCAKAVKSLADFTVYDGLDGIPEDSPVYALQAVNDLESVISQAVTSAYKHGFSLLTVYRGLSGAAKVQARSALSSSAIWDFESQTIKSAFTITGYDSEGRVTSFCVFVPGAILQFANINGDWTVKRVATLPGIVTAVPIVYDPQLDRPFGRSRITKALRSYTDMAVRTLVRMEASAEFYSVPKLWFLGLDPEAMSGDGWNSLISQINAISRDEDGNTASPYQVQQASMSPHAEMLRTLALLAASETNLPAADLGVNMAVPQSAEALAEAERKLTREADRQNSLYSKAVKQALVCAAKLDMNINSNPQTAEDAARLRVLFKPTQEQSAGARGDMFAKIAANVPSYVSTVQAWRNLGFSDDDALAILREVRKDNALSFLERAAKSGGSVSTVAENATVAENSAVAKNATTESMSSESVK